MTLIFMSVGFMAFMAATTLAIDVGMFMTARSQAQNSADAGAHAGVVALVFNDFNDRSASGPAVQSALKAARSNQVVRNNVSVNNPDVTFPVGPTGSNRVKVTVYRTTSRGNAVPTLIGSMFGVLSGDVIATATAEASPADAETCVMPFTIPDKWLEKQDPPWDPTDTFDMYDNKGKPIANPDVYIAPGSDGWTGYSAVANRGLQLVLKNNNTGKVAPSLYNPWDLPGSVGGSDYRNNIANCNTAIFKIGDLMPPEPGNMVGPTQQGADALVAKDPGAYWDTGCQCVKGSNFGVSPRVAVVPLYDPIAYAEGQASGKNATFKMVNYLGFFIEGVDGGGQVTGRITPITGLISGGGGPVPTGAFPMAIRLVE